MGRRQRVVDPDEGAGAEFAVRLRELRAHSGLTYRQLAARSNYSASVLSEAARGLVLPSWPVTRAFVSGCGSDPGEWHVPWQRASNRLADEETRTPQLHPTSKAPRSGKIRLVATGPTPPAEVEPVPSPTNVDPQFVTTEQEFLALLQELKEQTGLSYNDIASRTRPVYPLAKSTVHALLTGARPHSPEHLRALLTACGAEGEYEKWVMAWRRAAQTRRDDASPHAVPTRKTSQALANLLGPTRAGILTSITTGTTVNLICHRVGISQTMLARHATVLRDAGLITQAPEGASVCYTRTAIGDAVVVSSQQFQVLAQSAGTHRSPPDRPLASGTRRPDQTSATPTRPDRNRPATAETPGQPTPRR